MSQKIPTYLFEKSNLIRTVIFTALFALVFINLYQPFDSKNWYFVSDVKYFLYSSLIILAGMLIVVVSKIIMYFRCRREPIKIYQYVVWVIMEILIMAIFYTMVETIATGSITNSLRYMLIQSIVNTSLILLLPYSGMWLYLNLMDKKKKLEKFKEEEIFDDNAMCTFYDDNNNLKLSVKRDQVIYIISADNYCKIYYKNKGKVSVFMLRITLKKIEERFEKSSLVRCHRSFIINFEKVKVLKKEKTGIFLELDEENTPDIPVSKTYSDRIMSLFSKYSI